MGEFTRSNIVVCERTIVHKICVSGPCDGHLCSEILDLFSGKNTCYGEVLRSMRASKLFDTEGVSYRKYELCLDESSSCDDLQGYKTRRRFLGLQDEYKQQ